MNIEQWHKNWRMLPAQIEGTGAVIECVDCKHQRASYEQNLAFEHAHGCTVAEEKPQFRRAGLRAALQPAGVVALRSTLDNQH